MRDNYGHDLSNLIISNFPNFTEDISNIQYIKSITYNYSDPSFYIYYNFISYNSLQENINTLIRKVVIDNGPYIEFNNLKTNSNYILEASYNIISDKYFNVIDLSITRLYDTNDYNKIFDFNDFLLDISSYIYNSSGEIINLKYQVTLSGNYIDFSKNITQLLIIYWIIILIILMILRTNII